MSVVTRHGGDGRRQHHRQRMQEAGRIGHAHPRDAGELRGLRGNSGNFMAKHGNFDLRFAQSQRASTL